ncbi:MAG: acyltransferase [Proteobacteria bacterium]|nr:acyltransferase [Pseudomonadota bacterium]
MLAVVPVVLYHAGLSGFGGGFVGVDVFFVISGFLITGILRREIEEGRFSIAGFYERRVRRILPALLALIAACLLAGYFVLLPLPFMDLAQSTLWTLAFASNAWFYRRTSDYFAPTANSEPLLHTWSLAVEEQFYIGFPILLWWVMSRRRNTLAIIGALVGLSFGLSLFMSVHNPAANFYLAPTRIWELGIGAGLAFLPRLRPVSAALAEAAALAGVAALVFSVTFYTRKTAFPGAAALLPCLGAALVIWAGGERATVTGRCLSAPLPVGIGLISYSLYLWHWPILVLARLRFGTDNLSAWETAGAVALALLMAWTSWRFIERPFRLRHGKRARRATVFATAAVAAIAVGLPSATVVIRSGLPGRLPENVQSYLVAAAQKPSDADPCANAKPPARLCDIGQPGANDASVLLWGDSHAGALAHGLDLTLRRLGQSGALAYKLACPPMLGVERIDGGVVKGCAAFNDQVMAELTRRKDLRTVILYSRWTLSSEGRGEWPWALLRPVGDETAAGGETENFTVFRDHFGRTIEAIVATGRRVVIIQGTPNFSFSPPESLVALQMIGAPAPVAPDATEIRERNSRTNQVIEAATQLGHVVVLDPLPILCDPRCITELGGRPLYSDSDHLSYAGSDYLAPRLLGPLLGK